MTHETTEGYEPMADGYDPDDHHRILTDVPDDAVKATLDDLTEGDIFYMRANWYSDGMVRPMVFAVTREMKEHEKEMAADPDRPTPMAHVKARGRDGHKYKIYYDNVHVECLTDDKDGYDRGGKSSRVYILGNEK